MPLRLRAVHCSNSRQQRRILKLKEDLFFFWQRATSKRLMKNAMKLTIRNPKEFDIFFPIDEVRIFDGRVANMEFIFQYIRRQSEYDIYLYHKIIANISIAFNRVTFLVILAIKRDTKVYWQIWDEDNHSQFICDNDGLTERGSCSYVKLSN